MDLSPYLEALRRDLSAAAAPGGEDVTRAAELLGGSLESSARLCLLEALSDAAAEITTRLDDATVEVRLRGREADLVVTEVGPPAPPAPPPPPAAAPLPPPLPGEAGDLARVTLRLPEPLKEQVEQTASREGISVNAWLVRAIATAIQQPTPGPGFPMPPTPPRRGRRITGFAQA